MQDETGSFLPVFQCKSFSIS